MPNQPLSKHFPTGNRLMLLMLSLYPSGLPAVENLQAGQSVLPLQQQQQRDFQRLQQEQRMQQLQREQSAVQAPKTDSPARGLAEHSCWTLSGLRLSGVTLFDAARLREHLAPLITACMGVNRINHLLVELTRLYLDDGYIASRAYLVKPAAHGQPLEVHVDEGYLEAIELADQSLPVWLAGAFPGMLGKPLELRHLEQGLDQLNRLRSLDLIADITPGSRPGASRVILRSQANSPAWAAALGLDTLGAAASGRDRSTLSLSLDSPLQLNDSVSFSFSDTLNDGPRYSRSFSLLYALPYGYWTHSLFASHVEYRVPLKLSRTTLYSSGRADQFGLRSDRVLWRKQDVLLSVYGQLAYKNVDNYLAKTRLAIQSPTLAVAESGLSLFWLDSGVWSLDLNYGRGLHGLGADDDSDRLSRHLPKAQFKRYRASVGRWRNGLYQGQPWQWQSQFSLQYSPDPLPVIEQLLVTDDSAVRGFRRNSASGATAALWRNTLRLPLNSGLLVRLTPYLGIDAGWVKGLYGTPDARMSAASAGLNLAWKHVQLDLDYQHSLSRPTQFAPESQIWLARLSLLM